MKPELASADTLPAGSRVGEILAGKYRIERLLGRGGMGEVYEARHVVVGRRFAVKFLHPHLARATGATARFLREARAAGSLDSPHLVAVIDFDTQPDGSPFLVMEYLTGESLATLLAREGRLPLRRALSIVLQACEGLDAAHRAGIVHRDLKPDNVLVTKTKDGTELIKVLDFGVAKLLDPESDGEATQSGAVLGTPFYMAPEQARGEKSIDLRVDVYALGVLTYELLSGQKPHPGAGYNAILAHILTQPIAPLSTLCPELPAGLVTVVERALAFDPARRQSSAAALSSELSPFAGRDLPMQGDHFDLRAPAAVTTELATQAPSSTAGTLASAVGDVPAASAARSARRRAPWAVAAIALTTALAVWKNREVTPREPREATASAARSGGVPAVAPSPAMAASTAARPTPSVEGPAPAPLPLAPSASTSLAPRAGATSGRPSVGVAASRRATPSDTTFDEKNPY